MANPTQPDERKKLRDFGLLMFFVLGLVIPLFLMYRNDWLWTDWSTVFLAAGLAFLLPALIFPALLRPVFSLWMGLALVLGFIMTHIIITLVYYLLIFPTGLIRRTFGTRDPLGLVTEKESYWIKKEPVKDKTRYEKQF